MTCADGHDVPTGAAHCPTGGSPVSTVSQPVPGWYADPAHDNVQRHWDGSSWTSQTAPASSPPNATAKSRKVIVLAVAAAVVVLGAIVDGTAQMNDHSDQHGFEIGSDPNFGRTLCGVLLSVHTIVRSDVEFPSLPVPVCRDCASRLQ